ncbi:MAG TPA: hypothetical protein VG165_04800 [Solirubrobacteraceae bacterium]|jgi:hypothetical protein|nr:hypothetical protein [Solirubrobacteraceae bacterium]
MGTIRGLLKCWVALLLGGLAIAAPASAASAFTTLFNAYRQTGAIASCKYSVAQLQSAESEVPPDIAQYAPDFPAALQAALQARARGVCGGSGSASATAPKSGAASKPKGPAPPSPAGVTPSPSRSVAAGASPIAAAAAAAPTGGGSGTGKVALIVVAALMAALAAAAVWWTVAVLRGRDPAWMGPAGHALGEVRLRAGGALREFADWIRLGR